jgi:hypothetical protein
MVDPKPGEIWRHPNGLAYEVVALAWPTWAIGRMVVYRHPDGETWVRPLAEWHTWADGGPGFTLA